MFLLSCGEGIAEGSERDRFCDSIFLNALFPGWAFIPAGVLLLVGLLHRRQGVFVGSAVAIYFLQILCLAVPALFSTQ